MANFKPILLVTMISLFFSCQSESIPKIDYTHPIPYQPENYICYKTDSLITIDGKLVESIWQKTPITSNFVDIEGDLKSLSKYQTSVKMLWDDTYLYFGAYLEEPHIWGEITERDAVIFQDNDFEIFIDPDGDTHNYYEFEINALNTIWDLLLLKPYREDGLPKVLDSWDIQGIQSAVHINGTLNDPSDIDSAWTVEVAIPWKVLEEMTPKAYMPKEGVQWRVNFSRVNWHMETTNGKYEKQKDINGEKLPEENWVWSPQGYIAMHAPETWGFVQFSETIAGPKKTNFIPHDMDKIKWALRQLYYQQNTYFETHQRYTDKLTNLTLPKVTISGYDFKPQLLRTYNGYEIIAKDIDSQYVWMIRADGKIIKIPSKL